MDLLLVANLVELHCACAIRDSSPSFAEHSEDKVGATDGVGGQMSSAGSGKYCWRIWRRFSWSLNKAPCGISAGTLGNN